MEGKRDYVCVGGVEIALFLSAFFSVDVRRNARETLCQSLSFRAAYGVVRDPDFGIRQVWVVIPAPSLPLGQLCDFFK